MIKQVKSKNRNGMADETLDSSLRLAPLTLVLMKGTIVPVEARPHPSH